MESTPQTGSGVSDDPGPAPGTPPRRSAGWAVLGWAVLSLALMIAAGVALGYLSHRIGLGHPRGLIFKVLIAFPLSVIGVVLLHYFAYVRRHVIVHAGLGAVAAMLGMHYFEYRDFPRTLEPRLRDVVEAQVIREMVVELKEKQRSSEEQAAKLSPEEHKELKQAISTTAANLRRLEEKLESIAGGLTDPEKEREMAPVFRRFDEELTAVRARIKAQGWKHMAIGERNPELEPVVGDWIGNLGFWGYLDLRAEQGVSFDLFVRKVHLGYAGSYAYWIAEVVIAGLIAASIMHKVAAQELKKDSKSGPSPSESS